MPKKEKKKKNCTFPALTTLLGGKPFRSETEVTIGVPTCYAKMVAILLRGFKETCVPNVNVQRRTKIVYIRTYCCKKKHFIFNINAFLIFLVDMNTYLLNNHCEKYILLKPSHLSTARNLSHGHLYNILYAQLQYF